MLQVSRSPILATRVNLLPNNTARAKWPFRFIARLTLCDQPFAVPNPNRHERPRRALFHKFRVYRLRNAADFRAPAARPAQTVTLPGDHAHTDDGRTGGLLAAYFEY